MFSEEHEVAKAIRDRDAGTLMNHLMTSPRAMAFFISSCPNLPSSLYESKFEQAVRRLCQWSQQWREFVDYKENKADLSDLEKFIQSFTGKEQSNKGLNLLTREEYYALRENLISFINRDNLLSQTLNVARYSTPPKIQYPYSQGQRTPFFEALNRYAVQHRQRDIDFGQMNELSPMVFPSGDPVPMSNYPLFTTVPRSSMPELKKSTPKDFLSSLGLVAPTPIAVPLVPKRQVEPEYEPVLNDKESKFWRPISDRSRPIGKKKNSLLSKIKSSVKKSLEYTNRKEEIVAPAKKASVKSSRAPAKRSAGAKKSAPKDLKPIQRRAAPVLGSLDVARQTYRREEPEEEIIID